MFRPLSHAPPPSLPSRSYAERLSEMGVGYLHVQDGVGGPAEATWFGKVTTTGYHGQCERVTLSKLRAVFTSGGLISNGGHTAESAAACVANGEAEAVSFGRQYMANPDLAERIRDGASLSPLPPREACVRPPTRPVLTKLAPWRHRLSVAVW